MAGKAQYPPLRSPIMGVDGKLTDSWERYFLTVVTPYFERIETVEREQIFSSTNILERDLERRISQIEKLPNELWQTGDKGLIKRIEDVENALQFVDGPKDASLLKRLDELETLILNFPGLDAPGIFFGPTVPVVDNAIARFDGTTGRKIQSSALTIDDTGNMVMPDNAWIGLGAAKGRMEFDDQATDEINFLDCTVGIGTPVPSSSDLLQLGDGTATNAAGLRIFSQRPMIRLYEQDTIDENWQIEDQAGIFKINTQNDNFNNISTKLAILQNGNIGFGATTFGTNAAKTMALALGTDPTADVADQFAFWGKHIAVGNTGPYFRTENGTVIGLNQSLLDTDPVSFARMELDGPEALAIQTVTGNTTLDNTHSTVLVNASGNVIITLPTAASAYNNTLGIGRIYEIKKIDADADTVTIDPNGGEEIEFAATLVLTVQGESVTIQSNGTAWYVI